MFYRLSQIINIALSCLFLLLGLYALATANSIPYPMVLVLCFIFIAYSICLCFDFICFQIYKHNRQQIPVAKKLKTFGRIIFGFNLLAALGIFLCTAAAISSFSDFTSKSMQRQLPFYIIFLLVFLLSGITAVINLFFFGKSLKKNKTIVNTFINDIGHQL